MHLTFGTPIDPELIYIFPRSFVIYQYTNQVSPMTDHFINPLQPIPNLKSLFIDNDNNNLKNTKNPMLEYQQQAPFSRIQVLPSKSIGQQNSKRL